MKTVNPDIIRYVESHILPRYRAFDKGHNTDHADKVINTSMELAGHYEVDPDKVYVIAAYHDLGLEKDRDTHHLESARILLNDKQLKQWFSADDLQLMAEAVEDHRASSGREPRSIYGKIVAEADRDINPDRILQRTVQYGLAHYPEYDMETHWQRFVEHLYEKYAAGGYLRLWIPYSDNARQLDTLRNIIADTTKLRKRFEHFYRIENSQPQ
ncbi:MAG: HD domain-containing protein [Paludibacteraceae bacterium]|nr:HD domain-containing protein [Paludibacteraceae bacterium]